MQFRTNFRKVLLILCASGCINACTHQIWTTENQIQSIELKTTLDPNYGSVTRVDVVFLLDADLIHSMPDVAADWHQGKPLFVARYSGSLLISSVKAPPLTNIRIPLPDGHRKAVRVFAFVSGVNIDNRLELTDYRNPQIRLSAERATLIE